MSETATAPAPEAAPTTPPAGGFLGAAPAAAPQQQQQPAPDAPSFFLDGRFHKDGSLNEGWAGALKEAGYERLANKGALVKNEGDFLRSLDDALGLVGKKAAGYPTATSSESEVAEYRRSAGVPDDAKSYVLKPEKLPDGIDWDQTGADEFAGVLHKHHAPAALAKELGEMWTNQQVKVREVAKANFDQQVNDLAAESAKTFGKEWGDKAEDRRVANLDYVRAMGLNLEDPVIKIALSHPQIVRIVDEARQGLREKPLPGVDQGVFSGSGSPRQQAYELMKSNPSWERDPALSKRISDLHSLQAQQDKRGKR